MALDRGKVKGWREINHQVSIKAKKNPELAEPLKRFEVRLNNILLNIQCLIENTQHVNCEHKSLLNV